MTEDQHQLIVTNLLQDQSRNQSQRADLGVKKLIKEDQLAEAVIDQPAEGEGLEVAEDPEAETEEEHTLDPGVDLALQEDHLKTMKDTDYTLQVC